MFKRLQLLMYRKYQKKHIKMTTIFYLSKTHQKKHVKITSLFHGSCIKNVHQNSVDFSSIHRNHVQKNYVVTMLIFCLSKLRRSKYVDLTSIFCQSKLSRTKYVKTTSIFCPLKLRQKSYVKTTSIFHTSKLHQKSMSKCMICQCFLFNLST